MLNFKKTYYIVAGSIVLNFSHGMLQPFDEDNTILIPSFTFPPDLKQLLINVETKEFIVKGKSKNKLVESGGLKKGLDIYPVLLINQEDYIHLSNHQGVALHTTDQADVAVGYVITKTESEIKDHPAIWIKRTDNTYNQFIDTKIEGRYSCIDETGTWVAGRHKIKTENAVIINTQTQEVTLLGPGKIFEMTWDGILFYGIRVIDYKQYACVWKRQKDGRFKEYIIKESEGLDSDTLFLDPETQDFVTYQKRGRQYRWSKLDGVVELIN